MSSQSVRTRSLIEVLEDHERSLKRLKLTLARVASSGGGGFPLSGGWTFRTDLTSNPTSGRMHWDNATTASVTNIYVNEIDASGADRGLFLGLLSDGEDIFVWATASTGDIAHFTVNGTPSLSAGVWTIPVTHVANDGTTPYAQNTAVTMGAVFNAGGSDLYLKADGTVDGTGEQKFKTDADGQLRLTDGTADTNSILLRNDGSSFFILVTDTEDGTWNALRPFYVNLSSGEVTLHERTIASDFDPITNNAYDLGDATLSWRNLYTHGIYDEAGTQRWDLNGVLIPASDIRMHGDQLFFNYGTETNSYLQHSTGSNYFRYVQAGSEAFRFFHDGTTTQMDLCGTGNSEIRKVEGTTLRIENEVQDGDIGMYIDPDAGGVHTRFLIDGASNQILFYGATGQRMLRITIGGNGTQISADNNDDYIEIDDTNNWHQFFLNASEAFRVQTDRIVFYDEIYGTTNMTGTASTGNQPLRHNTTSIQFYRWTSERRFKENIRTLQDVWPTWSEGIYDLNERVFDMVPENRQGEDFHDFDIPGYIADEFHNVFGNRGTGLNEDGEPSAWSETLLVVAHNVELKKHKAEIEELKAEVRRLKAHVA